MKKLLLILLIHFFFYVKGDDTYKYSWNGIYQFVSAILQVQLGDTYMGLAGPPICSYITSEIFLWSIAFDHMAIPADTFFQYIPQVAGLYEYVCTPHIPNGMIGEFTVIDGTVQLKNTLQTKSS